MKYVLIGLLRLYRFFISPLYGQVCRYHPTCSAYALEAVTVHGSIRGSWYALRRLASKRSRDRSRKIGVITECGRQFVQRV